MKKAALTTAILTALVSAPSFAATVYKNDGTELKVGGRVEFRGDFIGSDGAEVEGSMEDQSRARLNLKVKLTSATACLHSVCTKQNKRQVKANSKTATCTLV